MKKLIILIFLFLFTQQSNFAQDNQQSVRDFVEGKYFKNHQTGRSIKYGYISSLNTYGLTFKDTEGNLAYFINCTLELSSDEQYMELTFCMSPVTGGTLGRFVVSKDKMTMYGTDGTLTFYLEEHKKALVENNSSTARNQTSSLIEGSGNSSSQSKVIVPVQIIGKAKKIGNLEIAQNDFSWEMDWDDAKKACERLGEGWRLPTKTELSIIYKNKSLLGGFIPKNNYAHSYWTSTKYNEYSSDYYWYLNFKNGNLEANDDKSGWCSVRAVRTK